jgi:hypothetical protein
MPPKSFFFQSYSLFTAKTLFLTRLIYFQFPFFPSKVFLHSSMPPDIHSLPVVSKQGLGQVGLQ